MYFDIIFCMDSTNGIGKNNSIPWKVKSDMSFFKKMTMEKTVIMGRTTWESIPVRPLKERTNVVISQRADEYGDEQHEGARWFTNFDRAYEYALGLEKGMVVIGGKQLFNDVIKHEKLRYLYLTRLETSFQCDIFLDNIDDYFVEDDLLKTGLDISSDIGYKIKRYKRK